MNAVERRTKLALAFTAALALAALSLSLLPPPAFAELYGRRLYPALSTLFTLLTDWTRVPLGIAVLPPLVGLLLLRSLWRGPAGSSLASRLARLTMVAISLWAGYLLVWGLNYRRPPLLELSGVTESRPSDAEMAALAEELLVWLAANSAAPAETSEALAAVSAELEGLAWEIGWPARVPEGIKLLPPGSLLRAGYAGMLFPFTLEPQIDAALSPHSRVAIGAHELAHSAGFASEVDADLAAVIAGLRADHPFARYATALSLLARMLGSLSHEQRGTIIDRLPARAEADLAEARERSARYLRPSLAGRVTAVYNRLLQGQGVSGGVAAYGRVPRSAALARRQGLLPAPPSLNRPREGGSPCPDCGATTPPGPDRDP